jgi:L-lactate dehydrogenase (cytochrome)
MATAQQEVEKSPLISLSDLGKHNVRSDCWIAVHDKVWDVTNFINEHPGGPTGKPPL